MTGYTYQWKPALSPLLKGYGAVMPRQKPEDWRKVCSDMEEAMAEGVNKEDDKE
jgi:hypothetical protein